MYSVLASMDPPTNLSVVDLWIRNIQDIYQSRADVFEKLDPSKRADLLCEYNVGNSVINLAKSYILQNAWDRGQEVSIGMS
jgi:carbonic anhydrase